MEWEEIVFLAKAETSPSPASANVDVYNNTVKDTTNKKMGIEENDLVLE